MTSTQVSRHTIKRISSIDDIDCEIAHFFMERADALSKMTGSKFNWKNFDFLNYARHGLFLIALKDNAPVGGLLARLYESVFDYETKILFCDVMHVEPGNSRATYMLIQEFIDFGKANANHILTATHEKTNIKRRSLERLGFKKLEELYRLEV